MKDYYSDPDYWNGNTFANDTYHTLKLFYLERGGTDSNLSMRFNLAYVPETEGVKIDQDGTPLSGVEFSLYAAEKTNDGYEINTALGTSGLLATGTTDANGRFVLADGEDAIISLNEFSQRGIKYLILKENNTNDGYRPESDLYLVIETDNLRNAILLNDANHHWQTGSYVSAKKTVQTGAELKLNTTGADDPKTADLDKGGTAFAVVMRRLTNVGEAAPAFDDEWGVVTGSALSGWKVVGRNTETGYIDAVRKAIQADPTCYTTFQLSTNGSYMAEIKDCPGDIRDYYFWKRDVDSENFDDCAYSISYYYTPGTMEQLKNGEDVPIYWVNSLDFERVFAAKLYIPNVKNYLYVNKVSEAGEPLSGVEFSLYNARDLTVSEDGSSCTINAGVTPVDTVTTGSDGSAVFPSAGHALVQGDYYMVESSAPQGYAANGRQTGARHCQRGRRPADAGIEGDGGITTEVQLGSLVKTMAQFATADDIDRTLTDIKATRLKGELNANGDLILSTDESSQGKEIELTVDTSSASSGIQYKPSSTENSRTGPGHPTPAGRGSASSRTTRRK